MYEQIEILKPRPRVLQIRLVGRKPSLLVLLGFLALWYLFFLSSTPGNDLASWTFGIAPLLAIPAFLHLDRAYRRGHVIEIDAVAQSVKENGTEVAEIGRIQSIFLRKIHSKAGNAYRLSLVLDDESRIVVAHTTDQPRIEKVAEDIVTLLGLEVVRK